MTPYYDDRKGIVIYCGDCRDIIPTLEPGSVDLVLTDPPYGMRYIAGDRANGQESAWGSRWAGVAIAGDENQALRDWVLAWWGDRPALVFGSWKTPAPDGVREMLVWDKVVSTGMGALDIPWRPSWEAIYVMGKGFCGSRGHGVLRFPLPTLAPDRQWHPTVKPLPLLAHLLTKCPPEWCILDPFMGSGTTLRAAKDLGRRAIGIEIEERYCEIAVNRLQQGVLAI